MRHPLSLLLWVWKSIIALFRLMRIGNVVIVAASVFLGAYIVQGSALNMLSPNMLRAAISLALLAAAGYVMNDMLDLESDRVNRPTRPLVVGTLSLSASRVIFVGLVLLSLGLVTTLTSSHQTIFALIAVVLVAYNVLLSKLPLVGNLSVGLIVALSIPYGALPFGFTPTIWIAAGFAFATTLARELIKDVDDMEGDLKVSSRSLPIVIGAKPTVMLVQGLSLTVVLFSVLPYLFANFGGLYLIMIGVTDILLILPMARKADGRIAASSMSSSLKWAMLTGMVALACAESIPSH